MSDYHTIRLHGPWQADFFTPEANDLSDNHRVISQQRIRLPIDKETVLLTDDLLAGEAAASLNACQVKLSRHFNWPHGQQDRVFLNIESNTDWQIRLNGRLVSVATTSAARPESISSYLDSRNQLELLAKFSSRPKIRIDEISLKIVQPNR